MKAGARPANGAPRQPGGEQERLARLGDVPRKYLPPAPRLGPFRPLDADGVRR